MQTMRAFLITVVVILLVLVGLDFGARWFATAQVEKAIAKELDLPTRPDVSVSGFPFLWQAFRGDYGSITLTTDSLALGAVENVNATITMTDVRIPFTDAVSGNMDHFTAARADLSASIPTSSLAAAAGQPTLTITAGPSGGLVLNTQVEVAGQTIPVTAAADAVISDSELKVTISDLSSQITLPAAINSQLRGDLSLTIPLTGLPVALTKASVQVDGSNVLVTGTAVDITLADLKTT
ncbi:DUF2993 domain-containing protein [Nakamurella silvestris]|nr:DUF2993 domain-containing protein [Nakamurella silvestris]